MNIKLASPLQYDSIVDGEGIRTVIWTQGCPHNCPSCHNPETHDFNGGILMDINDIKKELSSNKNQDGITLSGGDPFVQPEACYEIANYAKELGLNVWCYTGFTFEEIINMSKKNAIYKKLLENIDVLIDGKFILQLKNFNLKYRGSSNQRIIDVKKSLESKEIILLEKYYTNTIGQDLYKRQNDMFI